MMRLENLPIVKDEKDCLPLFIDQRELILKYQIPVSDIYPFFEGLKEGKILAPKCSTCSRIYFPPQSVCPFCKKSEMQWIELSREAQLLAFTQIIVKPQSFQDEGDYYVGVARLKEGINVLARVVTDKRPRVGSKLRLEVTKNNKGNLVYCFVPID
ncbi:hypothetical protein B9Q12_00235 [Candidatus Marsarchaeota G2 archaeon ECH_B_SAG-G06]|uniref:DUF35 domain-containing protein n=3 Tax=Candidatus Marsarchaeota TaxID=1978152 RepID=A0A2R6C3W9_9ARCH|nr:MAG: hypothetical protein B9Q12_00235 [Candidatus Marsarchaeota G2 archaeon ECH_B_SAG-G06]